MALDVDKLKQNIATRTKQVDVVKGDAPGEIGNIIGKEVAAFIEPLVKAFNEHVHSGVIVSVAGGSGAPAVGTPGNSGASNKQV